MKKRIRLNESELINLVNEIINEETEGSNKFVLKGTQILDTESKKKRFIELCKECIAEFEKTNPGFSRDMQVEQVLMGVSLFFIAGAVFLNFLVAAIPMVGGFILLGSETRKKWKKVIECAKNKKSEINNTIQESNMKKTIRLNESELIKLVQRIIKEDEMDMSSAETTGKKNCKVSLRNLLSNEKPYNFDYYKNGRYIFTVMEGKGLEQSPGGLVPIRQFNNMDKVFFINEGNRVTIDIRENKISRGDSFSISCSNGVANLSGKPQTYGP